MGKAIANVQSAISGIDSISLLIEATKNTADAVEASEDGTIRATYAIQIDELKYQIDTCVRNSGTPGSNLLSGDTLVLVLNESSASRVTVAGCMATSTGLGIATAATALDSAAAALRRYSARLLANLQSITARRDFTAQMVRMLTIGSDRLTQVSRNEEGANMVMLQAREVRATNVSSVAAQDGRALFALF